MFFWLSSSREVELSKVLTLLIIGLNLANLLIPLGRFITGLLIDENLLQLGLTLFLIIKYLIPVEILWERASLLKYLIFVLVFTSLLTQVFSLLTLSGSSPEGTGALNLLIAIAYRHAFPLKPLLPSIAETIPTRIFQARHLPFIMLSVHLIYGIFWARRLTMILSVLCSYWASWCWIRYFLHFPFANITGDHSEQFSFDLLFPSVLRPMLKPACAWFYTCACKLSKFWILRSDAGSSNLYAPNETAAAASVGQTPEDRAAYETRRLKALRFLEQNIGSKIIFPEEERIPSLVIDPEV